LRAEKPPEAVLVAERLAGSTAPRLVDLFAGLRAAGCHIAIGPDDLLTELTDGRDLGLILGLVQLPEAVSLADVVAGQADIESGHGGNVGGHGGNVGGHGGPPLLAAVDIVDPGNVGALLRTAHAGGAAALLACGSSDPFHPRAVRTSRGSVFKLPVIVYDTAADLLADLHRHGVAVVAAASARGTSLPEMTWPAGPIAVLMGNEAEGLSPAIAAAVDYRVTIPMAGGVDSFSVNAAAAIMLYAFGQCIRIAVSSHAAAIEKNDDFYQGIC
jgi:TrmH family RNA methyltransferase